MLRGSDLSLLKNQIFEISDLVASPAQKTYFDLLFREGVARTELEEGLGISVQSSLRILRKKILEAKPFLIGDGAGKYRGACRSLQMLATECDRRQEAHSEEEFSYTKLLSEIENIVDSNGTSIQQNIFHKYFIEGYGQTQIAHELGQNQSSIQKCIFGNRDFHYNKFYGGIINKVGKNLRKQEIPYCCHLVEPYGKLFNFILGT